ncbi:MAG: hypothetical protein CMK08_10190 [Ponticaulis sp.]|nr:hypothetical protein [Ponticaulis sp.]MBN04538.1 hypothetical protein [Ponticaulis sp.]
MSNWYDGGVYAEYPAGRCSCHACRNSWARERKKVLLPAFVVCSDCGNKRCPKATDHRLECTGSNKPGQRGSIYA